MEPSSVWFLDSENSEDSFSTPLQGSFWYPAIIDSTMKSLQPNSSSSSQDSLFRYNLFIFKKLFCTDEERDETGELKTLISSKQIFSFISEHPLLLQYFSSPFPFDWQQFSFTTSAQFVYTYIQFLLCHQFELESSSLHRYINLTCITAQHYICKCIPTNRKISMTCLPTSQQQTLLSSLFQQASPRPLTIYFLGTDSQPKIRFFHQMICLLVQQHSTWNQTIHVAMELLQLFCTVLISNKGIVCTPLNIQLCFTNSSLSSIQFTICSSSPFFVDNSSAWNQLALFFLLLQDETLEDELLNHPFFVDQSMDYPLPSLQQFTQWCSQLGISDTTIKKWMEQSKACLLLLQMNSLSTTQMELLSKWSHLEKGTILKLLKQFGLRFIFPCLELIYQSMLQELLECCNQYFTVTKDSQQEETPNMTINYLYIPGTIDRTVHQETNTVMLVNALQDYLIHFFLNKKYQYKSMEQQQIQTIFETKWIPFCTREHYYVMHCHQFEARNPLPISVFHNLMNTFFKLGLFQLLQYKTVQEQSYLLLHDWKEQRIEEEEEVENEEEISLPVAERSELQQLLEPFGMVTQRNQLQLQIHNSMYSDCYPLTMHQYWNQLFTITNEETEKINPKWIISLQYIKLVLYLSSNHQLLKQEMEWKEWNWKLFANALKEVKAEQLHWFTSLQKECLFTVYYLLSKHRPIMIPLLHSQQFLELLVVLYCQLSTQVEWNHLLQQCIIYLCELDAVLHYLVYDTHSVQLLLWNEMKNSFEALWKEMLTRAKKEWMDSIVNANTVPHPLVTIMYKVKSFVYFLSGMEKQELYSVKEEEQEDIIQEQESIVSTVMLLHYLIEQQIKDPMEVQLSDSLLQLIKLVLPSTHL